MTDRHGDGPQTADIQTLLPRGAFLVECTTSHTASGDQLSGRVEHIVSGRATSFESAATLIDFIHRILAALEHVNAAAGNLGSRHHDLNTPPARRPT